MDGRTRRSRGRSRGESRVDDDDDDVYYYYSSSSSRARGVRSEVSTLRQTILNLSCLSGSPSCVPCRVPRPCRPSSFGSDDRHRLSSLLLLVVARHRRRGRRTERNERSRWVLPVESNPTLERLSSLYLTSSHYYSKWLLLLLKSNSTLNRSTPTRAVRSCHVRSAPVVVVVVSLFL